MDRAKQYRLESEKRRNEKQIEEFLKHAELLEERNNKIAKELEADD